MGSGGGRVVFCTCEFIKNIKMVQLSGRTTKQPHGSLRKIFHTFFRDYFLKTGNKKIPAARIKYTKKIGDTRSSQSLHSLNPFGHGRFSDPYFKVLWEGVKLNFLNFFIGASAIKSFVVQEGGLGILPKLYYYISYLYIIDKDKRPNRHSCGILIGCFPCGITVMLDELFQSEGIAQVILNISV